MSTEGYIGSTDCDTTLLDACEQGSGVGDSVVCKELVELLGTLLFTAEKQQCIISPLLEVLHFIWERFSPVKLQHSEAKTEVEENKLSVPNNKHVGILLKEVFQQ